MNHNYHVGYFAEDHAVTLGFAKQDLPPFDGFADFEGFANDGKSGLFIVRKNLVVVGKAVNTFHFSNIVFWRAERDFESDLELMTVSQALATREREMPQGILYSTRVGYGQYVNPLAWWMTYTLPKENDAPIMLYNDEFLYRSNSTNQIAIWWHNRGS